MSTIETEVVSLAVIESLTPAKLFEPGTIDPLIERIKAEVRSVAIDITTDFGRKACASLAFKVARSKTFIDKQRLELVRDEKKRLAAIDKEGTRIWNALEDLQKEVRQPLTAWEQEQERIEAERLEQVRLAEVREQVNRDHEFALLMDAEVARQKEDARKAAEQATKDREARIAQQARDEAEAKAKRETERLERERREADEARIRAEERAKRSAEIATQLERERVERERKYAEEAEAKREANKRHVAKVNREAIAALTSAGIDSDIAVTTIQLIAEGKVPNVKISY
jgi:colicin import membrane protein